MNEETLPCINNVSVYFAVAYPLNKNEHSSFVWVLETHWIPARSIKAALVNSIRSHCYSDTACSLLSFAVPDFLPWGVTAMCCTFRTTAGWLSARVSPPHQTPAQWTKWHTLRQPVVAFQLRAKLNRCVVTVCGVTMVKSSQDNLKNHRQRIFTTLGIAKYCRINISVKFNLISDAVCWRAIITPSSYLAISCKPINAWTATPICHRSIKKANYLTSEKTTWHCNVTTVYMQIIAHERRSTGPSGDAVYWAAPELDPSTDQWGIMDSATSTQPSQACHRLKVSPRKQPLD